MTKKKYDFIDKYGSTALIAGSALGLGESYADILAKIGFNLILIDNNQDLLNSQVIHLKNEFNVNIVPICIDLSDSNFLDVINKETFDIEISLLIYIASKSNIGYFLDFPIEDQIKIIDLNCKAPCLLTHHFGKKMCDRKKGGIILMSSFSAHQGSPFITNYAATKSYNLILAEGLWYEFSPYNVDVLACVSGQILTPQSEKRNPNYESGYKPPLMEPKDVVIETLDALGKKGSFIPGRANRINSFFLRKFIPRHKSIKIVGKATKKMYPFITNKRLV